MQSRNNHKDMNGLLANKYLLDSRLLADPPAGVVATTCWECPANIALVKYWGKKPDQLPQNPSVSFVLQRSKTILTMDFAVNKNLEKHSIVYQYEGYPHPRFESRIMDYLNRISVFMPFLNQLELSIHSRNTFPHSTGIASSASSFGALALAVCEAERLIFGTLKGDEALRQKASFLARLGSGSASRSVYGGFSLWGSTPGLQDSSDERAIPLSAIVNPLFLEYHDSILIIDSGKKAVTSSTGHSLMEKHPFMLSRIEQAHGQVVNVLDALARGDESLLIRVAEEEALTLHALMMSSSPGFLLMKPATIAAIEKIRLYRMETGRPVCFTMDAGANVHILYPGRISKEVELFLETDLKDYCENGRIIYDSVGNGPTGSGALAGTTLV
jgi:diphosphomevalonate decarboxylase